MIVWRDSTRRNEKKIKRVKKKSKKMGGLTTRKDEMKQELLQPTKKT